MSEPMLLRDAPFAPTFLERAKDFPDWPIWGQSRSGLYLYTWFDQEVHSILITSGRVERWRHADGWSVIREGDELALSSTEELRWLMDHLPEIVMEEAL